MYVMQFQNATLMQRKEIHARVSFCIDNGLFFVYRVISWSATSSSGLMPSDEILNLNSSVALSA